jgi:hypothetical protein
MAFIPATSAVAYAPLPQAATPAPQPPGTPPPPGATPVATPTPTPGSNTTITENIFHILSFPFETMMEAIVNMSNEILQAFYKDAEGIYGEALNLTLFNDYGIAPNNLGTGSSTPLFANIIRSHWDIALALALILLPATLTLTTVSALRMGATSALGYADLKEALFGWLIGVGAAVASFYLLGLAHRLSLAAAKSILEADFGEQVSGFALATAFFNAAALAQVALLFPPAALYVGFFVVFLATTLILALGLAIAAYTALVYLLSVIAPVVIMLGVLPPLRWLHALWLKTITLVFLIPVVDAFLLKAALSLYRGFFDPDQGGNLFGFIASLFILGGVLSVLITLNFKVGEMVFGALAEIHRQAWDATTGIMQLVLSAAALLAGGLIGGAALGGAGAVVAEGGSGGGAAGLAAPTSAPVSPPAAGGGTGAPITARQMPGSAETRAAAGAATPSAGLQSTSTLGSRIEELANALSTKIGGTRSTQGRAESGAEAPDSSTPPVGASPASRTQADGDKVAREGDQVKSAPLGGDVEGRTAQPDLHESGGRTEPDSSHTAEGQAEDSSAFPTAESVRTSSSPSGREFSPPATGVDVEAQMRRARLAEGFGRLLAHGSRNPAARSFGAGLQAGSLLSQHQAAATQPALSPESQAARQQELLLGNARRWSTSPELNHEPYALFDLGRDNTDLMLGGMFRSFMQTERAVDLQGLLPVVQGSYGQWLAQGRPGGLAAQREFFDLAMQEGNKASPGHMNGALSEWATRYAVRLDTGLASQVQQAFTTSVDIKSDQASNVDARIQKLLRTFK